ncbi:MAG: hypothetical protein ABWY02_03845 [Telluria sp.]
MRPARARRKAPHERARRRARRPARRFVDPAWQHWPWNALSQGLLLQQQWWHRATRSVRGMSLHHGAVTTFVARQLLDCVAPWNFVFTNPVVLRETARRGGMKLVAGATRAVNEAWRAASGEAAPPSLRPGRYVLEP